MTHSGSSPSPFDAVSESRLAGPEGSHPLADLRAEDLLRPTSGAVDAEFAFDGPAVVGEGLTGTLRLRANEPVRARGAPLRLLGLRLVEESRSSSHKNGDTWVTENWVEANGDLFVHDTFLEPTIPADLGAGQTFETRFAVPMPALGPPSGHLGVAIVAWALEVRWDVAMAEDAFVAHLLPIAQNPSLIRAGVGRQGGAALLASVEAGRGATIEIRSPLPALAGGTLDVVASWPAVPSGRVARVELVQHVEAPNGGSRVVSAVAAAIDDVRAGGTDIALPIPDGLAPSFDGADLACRHTVRVVVDRPMRPDESIEREVAIS
jgi:hypothetical protein